MRRAILAGRNVLGFDGELLLSIIPTVIRQFSGVYTELAEKNDIVLRYASIEEKQFRRTLDDGAGRLESLLDGLAPGSKLSGDDAFTLFATYGFPLELTIESAAEHNIDVDKARFTELIEEHAKISHGGRVREVMQVNEVVRVLRDMSYKPTEFTGYDEISTKAKVLAIFSGSHSVTEASEGQSVRIVLDKTPFYAESGGQVGDTGSISGDGFEASVSDTQKDSGYFFHDVEVTAGVVKIFDHVSAKIDEKRRFAIRQNHTSTHLLHKALQSVLGSHVQQRGSLVSADKLRFDFSHDQALTEAESRKVEEYVNDLILRDLPVGTLVKPIDEAREMGAMMLFGEKYGDTVRVVQVGSESLEFCGGTHLSHTSQAGSFKLLSEGSSQAGVRRIEALTGRSALAFRTEQERILSTVAAHLKTAPGSVLATVEKLQSDLKAAEKELHELKRTAAGSLAETLAASAKDASGFKYVAVVIDEEMDGGALRELADNLLDRLKEGVVALGAKSGDRASLAVKASKSVLENKNINAGSIIKAAAQVVGGGGGGKPNFAQAGGKDPSKLADAIALAEELILKA
jgi:alanyl-tRNA synthetase